MNTCYTRLGYGACAISGFTALVIAAAGAHTVTDTAAQALIEKASTYQLLHSIALLWLMDKKGRAATFGRGVFALGILCFCGSLYLRAFGLIDHAALAPTGGMLLMSGWLCLAFLRKVE